MTRVSHPRIGICDYGVGNLRSVERALGRGGGDAILSADAQELADCDGLVLPGVGAFAVAAQALRSRGLDDAIRAVAGSGRPILGVCLGFQLLFNDSDEGVGEAGLGLIPGRVRRLRPAHGKVPHMGWNRLTVTRPSSLLAGVNDGAYAYFVHSYAATPDDEACVVAMTDHGGEIVAAVEAGNIAGTQFHPEKSGTTGLHVYASFVSRCTAGVRA